MKTAKEARELTTINIKNNIKSELMIISSMIEIAIKDGKTFINKNIEYSENVQKLKDLGYTITGETIRW